ncbi:MAG TPA: hypothetical protein VEA38_10570 [Terriglobales bacterium]|nr:hypothetical protein [Terriglobales bacterium]
MRRAVVLALGAALLLAAGAREASAQAPGLPELRAKARQSRAEQLRATRDYKASLDRLLAVRENDVQRRLEDVDKTRALVERGLLARADLDAAERAASAARSRLDETWNEAVLAASLIAKTLAHDELASARPLSPGGEQATATLVRFRGQRAWSLGLTRTLEQFFTRTFGRALPVSAYGQTALHDKLGFDHRNAVDLAVHPDTPEGKAVMDWLRRSGLSFIAFRGAVAGAATGAHIHVGEPSQRLVSP